MVCSNKKLVCDSRLELLTELRTRVTVYENYVGPKVMKLESLWDGLVSVVYLTNFDSF